MPLFDFAMNASLQRECWPEATRPRSRVAKLSAFVPSISLVSLKEHSVECPALRETLAILYSVYTMIQCLAPVLMTRVLTNGSPCATIGVEFAFNITLGAPSETCRSAPESVN